MILLCIYSEQIDINIFSNDKNGLWIYIIYNYAIYAMTKRNFIYLVYTYWIKPETKATDYEKD